MGRAFGRYSVSQGPGRKRDSTQEDRGGKGGVRETAGKTRGQEPQRGDAAPPGLTGLWMEADVSPKWGGRRVQMP